MNTTTDFNPQLAPEPITQSVDLVLFNARLNAIARDLYRTADELAAQGEPLFSSVK